MKGVTMVVETNCWTDGDYMGGTHTWLQVDHSGIKAYVHRASMSPPAGLPHC